MAKTKTPFFSIGSRGTVGGVLTSQKRGGDTILRETPVPTDPYSLAQAYQRWDYRDYAYLWTLLTNSEKQVYRTRASRYHITGFSLWMKEHLKDLPDIALRWHLDERSGAVVYDTSRNANNGVIVGASPTPGLIDNAYSFDGLNDTIVAPDAPSLRPTTDISIDFFVKWPASFGANSLVFCKRTAPVIDLNFYFVFAMNVFIFQVGGSWACRLASASVNWGGWNHMSLGGESGTNNWYIFIEGVDKAINLGVATFAWSTASLYLASMAGAAEWSDIDIDHFTIYNRLQNATEAKRHSLRRYPA